jgi:hypothetical protein
VPAHGKKRLPQQHLDRVVDITLCCCMVVLYNPPHSPPPRAQRALLILRTTPLTNTRTHTHTLSPRHQVVRGSWGCHYHRDARIASVIAAGWTRRFGLELPTAADAKAAKRSSKRPT